MITISINVAVGAGSILMFAGFMLGYAIAWRQRRSFDTRSEVMTLGIDGGGRDDLHCLVLCEPPLQADELERLRLYRLMNPTDMHP